MSNDQPSQTAEELLHAALLSSSTDGLESWQVTLELLHGWINAAIAHGWPEPMARALVFDQVRSNLRSSVAALELAKRP